MTASASLSPSLPDHPDRTIDIRTVGATTVIALSGRLHGALSADEQDRVVGAIQNGGHLVIDFSQVAEISGAALRRLLLLTRYVHGLGGTVDAQGASDELRAIAEASGFEDLFRHAPPLPIPAARQAPRARADSYPTHSYRGFALRPGMPLPLGASALPHGVNFAVYSRHGTQCTLVLYEPGAAAPFAEIPFPPEFRVGDVHAMMVFHLDPEEFEYGFRMEGPFAPRDGHRFDRERVLLDPCCRAVAWRPSWGQRDERLATPRSRLIAEDFDWEDDRPLALPLEGLVLYEMHVRGFTRHPTSGVRFPGTFAGLREKIPYLVDLGVNCVELLPIFEFDETEVDRVNPVTGDRLVNYCDLYD